MSKRKRNGSPAGDYNHRITVWRNEPTTNPDGQQVEVPVEFIERWVSVETMDGTEGVIGKQTQAHVTHRVKMRYDTQTQTITAKMWITLRDGTRLDITNSVDVTGRKIELELSCTQRI